MTGLGTRLAGCLVLAALGMACGGSGGSDQATSRKARREVTKIGFLLDNTHERWERDRKLFVERVEQQGAEVLVEAAENDQARQTAQAEKMLADGVKVLVVVPHDLEGAAALVEKAKAKNVPVVCYDRLIKNADVDLYVTFDNVRVGRMQAESMLNAAPKGNYVLVGGSPTDFNAIQYREGQMAVLKPAVDSGAIRIVAEPMVENWLPETAAKVATEALDKNRNRVAAIVASNDQEAGAIIGVLETRKLAGKVAVSGQDAELQAVRRIVAGTQTMTVYKPLTALTRLAAAWAVRLANGDKPDAATVTNNGRKDVPTMVVDPIAVDKSNIDAVLIGDGFHTKAEIYGAGTN